MEVIQPGRCYGWPRKLICHGTGQVKNPGCYAQLRVAQPDLFRQTIDDAELGAGEHVCFRCPLCHSVTPVRPPAVPVGVELPTYPEWLAAHGQSDPRLPEEAHAA